MPRYDHIEETERVAKTFDEILKFNPYHDERGRFATANGAASFTYAPGKSKAHDKAIEREKARRLAGGGGGEKEEPKAQQQPKEPPKPKERPTQDAHSTPLEYFGAETSVEQSAKILADRLSQSSGQKISAQEADRLWDSAVSYSGRSYTAVREAQRTGGGDKETKQIADDI